MFPTGKKNCSEDENIDDYHPDLNDGYSQSKWVAEQLITRAGQKGLPVVIYRLGTIYQYISNHILKWKRLKISQFVFLFLQEKNENV